MLFDGDVQNTTESTTYAAMVGDCIRDHLDEAQLAKLMEVLVGQGEHHG